MEDTAQVKDQSETVEITVVPGVPPETFINPGVGEPPKPPIEPPRPIGRPCEYCKRKEEIDKVTADYLASAKRPIKPIIPFIQELVMILDVDIDTVHDWAAKKMRGGKLEHPDFSRAVKSLLNIQQLRLLNRTLGRFSPAGAIFQLKANHGMIETEKRLLGGLTNEPLEIVFTEEVKNE